MSVCQTIWNQIPRSVKMACGLREATSVSPTELRVKCLRANRWVLINLDPSDTYTVRFVRQERSTYRLITIDSASDIYCDQLGTLIYDMTHGLRKPA